MPAVSKREADAWDRVLDAAAELANLIDAGGIHLDEATLEELTLFLASHAAAVRDILKPLKRRWPIADPIA
jgi:dsDNA-binding SOS-regulon protein